MSLRGPHPIWVNTFTTEKKPFQALPHGHIVKQYLIWDFSFTVKVRFEGFHLQLLSRDPVWVGMMCNLWCIIYGMMYNLNPWVPNLKAKEKTLQAGRPGLHFLTCMSLSLFTCETWLTPSTFTLLLKAKRKHTQKFSVDARYDTQAPQSSRIWFLSLSKSLSSLIT